MLKDVIKIFEKEYMKGSTPENQDYFITKEHIPADGDYILLRETEDGYVEEDRLKIKYDRKTKTIEKTNPYFDFVQYADYLSRYLESNKAINDKNIHSNNYLTLFIKKENLFNGKINADTLSNYYEVFKDPYKNKYGSKPQLKKAYALMEDKHGKSNIERINKIESWVKENLFRLNIENDKSYLKLFFLYDIEEYKKESEKYIVTNIYNSADYNTIINGVLYGVPNNNMGLNSKKPFLEQKSRKNSSPILLNQEEVLLQKKFFDYLNNMLNKGLVNLYFNEEGILTFDNYESPQSNFSGYFMRIQKEMEPVIYDFDVITDYSDEIRPIKIHNFLRIKTSNLEYGTIYKLSTLKEIINDVMFRKCLVTNFFTEPQDINIYEEELKKNILMVRTSLFNWFYKGMDQGAWKILKKCCLDLIKGSIYRGKLWKDGGSACEQFNLYMSLKYYFERRELMDNYILDIDKIREKINQDTTGRIESDEEFYFVVGQLANYFISLSRAKTKNHFLSKSILSAKTPEKMKDELKKLYHKYSYDVKSNNYRFNNMYSMVCLYKHLDSKVNEDALLAGYLHSNLIYESKKKDFNDEDMEIVSDIEE